MAKNSCQYWVPDEPVVCRYWDTSLTMCTYTDFSGRVLITAPLAPYCNLIGTSYYNCALYTAPPGISANERGRCVLPDASRQVSRHSDCALWVRPVASGVGTTAKYLDSPVYTMDSSGNTHLYSPKTYWNFADINGYKKGDCDGKGTTVTCSGYSPYSLGFSALKPQEPTTALMNGLLNPENYDLPYCITSSGLEYRDPLSLSIFNLRAQLGRCRWWEGPHTDFITDPIDGSTSSIKSLCTHKDERAHLFQKYQLTPQNGYIAPCNGAKPECPGYSSDICWKYVRDKFMSEGDKVLAEQILELRYYLKHEAWGRLVPKQINGELEPVYGNLYNSSFLEPDLYSWKGTFELGTAALNTVSAIIPAIKNYFTQFEYFNVEHEVLNLTAGIPTRNQPSYFPTLVRDLKYTYLSPIIRTVFDKEVTDFSSSIASIFKPSNIFETSNINHKYLAIWGDSFYYNSYIFAINFSDPDLSGIHYIYQKLKLYENMVEMKKALSKEVFEDFYEDLDNKLNTLINNFPDKIFYNTLDIGENAFYINSETFFSDNDIVVFDSTKSFWEYDKISVTKKFIGALIGQTSFSVYGDGGTVEFLPDYRRGFLGNVNKNCKVGFTVFPINKENLNLDIAYIYNDTLTSKGACFKKYKITAYKNLKLNSDNVKFIGNKGKAVVIVPDIENKLHNIHSNWEIDGDITLYFTDPDGERKVIVMNIVNIEDESLEVNQILVQPRNLEKFTSPCSFELQLGKNIYTYEKRSFDEFPSGEIELLNNDAIQSTGKLDVSNNVAQISNFTDAGILASVVYKTSTGRLKGITRSKLLVWVRQPYCRDFEIMYTWSLEYTKWDLYPAGICAYSQTDSVLDHAFGKAAASFSPSCGDHDKSSRSQCAPMWYPYGTCTPQERYSQLSSAHGNITNIMGIFLKKDPDGNHLYGNWNLRMLGPQENFGKEKIHASIWKCDCDYSYYNFKKASDNIFSGYARYRGGLDPLTHEFCTRYGGLLPKFGNVYRDQLNSYRSLDRVPYLKQSGSSYSEDYRWMPAPEYFTDLNIFSSPSEVGMDIYSDDYKSPYYNQLGLLAINDKIEDISINEEVDYANRYRFEDIFDTNLSISLSYPLPRPLYSYTTSDGAASTIITWYSYKEIKPDVSIQWAWREAWKSLHRPNSKLFFKDLLLGKINENPYSYNLLGCLDIFYPDYLYDTKQRELRQVINEGDHFLSFVVSKPINSLSKENVIPFILLQIDDTGLPRVFDLDGNWVKGEELPENISFKGYNIAKVKVSCDKYYSPDITGTSWATTSSLYIEDLINTAFEAKAEEQYLFMYDQNGVYDEKYFKRGLDVQVNPGKFNLLPKIYNKLIAEDYEWSFSSPPVLQPQALLSNLVADEYFPASISLDGAEYKTVEPSILSITLDFSKNAKFFIPKVISKLILNFKYLLDLNNLLAYNVPNIFIYKKEVLEKEFSLFATVDGSLAAESSSDSYVDISIDLPFDYLSFKTPIKELKIELDNSLTSFTNIDEIQGKNCNKIDNRIELKEIQLTEVKIASIKELITTYERKYYVSLGKYGDIPPEGNNTSGKILFPPLNEISTPYHRDTSFGILGVPNSSGNIKSMNKCRGRILKSCHKDKEIYMGTSVVNMEREQKKIHDAVVEEGNTYFGAKAITLSSLVPEFEQLHLTNPSWECAFNNTLLMSLAPVIPQANFNDGGFLWSYDAEAPIKTFCGHYYLDFVHFVYKGVDGYYSYGGFTWMEALYQEVSNELDYGFFANIFDSFSGGLWGSDALETSRGDKSTVDTSKLTKLSF